MPLMLIGLGSGEIMAIALVILVVFGASKLPIFMRGMGQGIKEFKQAVKDDDEPRGEIKTPEPPAAA